MGCRAFFYLKWISDWKNPPRATDKPGKKWLFIFWIRRWFRTIPSYLLFLLINIFWYYYLQSDFPGFLFRYFTFTQNLAWEHPGFFPEAWSLAIEEWFYLIFPMLMIILIRCRLQVVNAYLISGAIILTFSVLFRWVCVVLDPSLTWDEGVRKIVVFRLDSLMYGVYLSWFIDNIINKKIFLFAGFVALFISMIACFTLEYDHSSFFKIFQFSITSLGFMLIIPSMLDFHVASSSLLGIFFRKTALWSYSMYLSNLLIYNMIQNLVFSNYFSENVGRGAVFCSIFLIVSCYLVSAIIYRIYELPLMNLRVPFTSWLKKRFFDSSRGKQRLARINSDKN